MISRLTQTVSAHGAPTTRLLSVFYVLVGVGVLYGVYEPFPQAAATTRYLFFFHIGKFDDFSIINRHTCCIHSDLGFDITKMDDDEYMKDFLQTNEGSITGSALVALTTSHRMWAAGQKPGIQIDGVTGTTFTDFLKNMTASQMATVWGAYRNASGEAAISGADDPFNGFSNYNKELGIYEVVGGDELAKDGGDNRMRMGTDAYQSEPYFEHFLQHGV